MSIAKIETDPIARAVEWTPDQIELIQRTVAKGATADEFKLFLYVAQKRGLDPLCREIYFIKRNVRQKDGSYREEGAIQLGVDGMLALAESTGEYAGMTEPKYEELPEGDLRVTVGVYRKGFEHPVYATALYSEYCQKVTSGEFKGQPTHMWKQFRETMTEKCAISKVLRRAFPRQTAGLYTHEEMKQADNLRELAQPEEITKVRAELAPAIVDAEVVSEGIIEGETKPDYEGEFEKQSAEFRKNLDIASNPNVPEEVHQEAAANLAKTLPPTESKPKEEVSVQLSLVAELAGLGVDLALQGAIYDALGTFTAPSKDGTRMYTNVPSKKGTPHDLSDGWAGSILGRLRELKKIVTADDTAQDMIAKAKRVNQEHVAKRAAASAATPTATSDQNDSPLPDNEWE